MADPFIGEIRMFGGNFAPRGWATCDGQLLSIALNNALFALLGTTYGGDGQSTFALPDLRGRVPIHQGQGPGLTPRVIGEQAGSENVTLLTSQMPAHRHPTAATGAATLGNPGGNLAGTSSTTAFYVDTPPTLAMSPDTQASKGGSQPHPNLMPYQCVNFIIALEGIFPSRN
jgi:microcystin-dependent protein